MRTLIPAILVLALALPVDASHCTTYSTSTPYAGTPALPAGPQYYVFNDPSWCCIINMWFYEETNGIPGPQRGDEVVDDTCHGMIPADTIAF